MKLSIIVAASENNVIGVNNQLPWHLPDDLKFFKSTTMHKPVLMGRNTWHSLNRPLPGRVNIVLSSSLKESEVPKEVLIAKDINHAQELGKQLNTGEIFIIGGGKVYDQFLPLCNTIYLTRVHVALNNGDAFFPVFHEKDWQLVFEEYHPEDERHKYAFTFQKYIR